MSLFDASGMLAFHLRQMRRDRILRDQPAVRGHMRFGKPPIVAAKVEKAKQALAAGHAAGRHIGCVREQADEWAVVSGLVTDRLRPAHPA
jgi:hypothetical protein